MLEEIEQNRSKLGDKSSEKVEAEIEIENLPQGKRYIEEFHKMEPTIAF